MKRYPEYKGLNLPEINKELLAHWGRNRIFEKSVESRPASKPFVFYEGPPSANGLPGIHHVMARAIKDVFCRYKTLQGFRVERKAGWDTHGLPVELGVEKEMGITKEDIGKKISIAEYNEACRKAVMKYTDIWNDLTEKMGYWVDMQNPYVTYENKYIETVWWLLKRLYDKDLLYKGYSIQPYSPAAGTGLSSHELNQPGCYRPVKDNTVVAMFKAVEEQKDFFYEKITLRKDLEDFLWCFDWKSFEICFLAWTTTPWTLPSNTALAVNPNLDYKLVLTKNPYNNTPVFVIMASALIPKFFTREYEESFIVSGPNVNIPEFDLARFRANPNEILLNEIIGSAKNLNCVPISEFKGSELLDIKYEQLLPYAQPMETPEKAFRIIPGDFVTTEDGTGIVHIAPTFGADDMRVAREAGVPPMLVPDEHGKPVPLVDLRGKFRPEMQDDTFGFAGEYIKEEYLNDEEKAAELSLQQTRLKAIIPELKKYLSADERLALKLKIEGKAFKIEKYEHSYPHCWRTDKPVLYYPLDSWFIRVTALRERMAELNKTINWKPESTGTGRFGNWLENANDWNLSRSRYWGIPLPIWRSEDGEEKCIGSAEELFHECEKSVQAGLMDKNPMAGFVPGDMSIENYQRFDLHRPYADEVILVSSNGKPMKRESDLIDVWFDSGAMPYAQLHYPFENKERVDNNTAFPADFIAEGVDQTRGWFYTLHAIATLCFDSVAYKNVVSNGLVLDKNGQKMSKRLGNAIDPFTTLDSYGADATRWYMLTNAQPWDNLKFDLNGITEVRNKFFGTLYNTYSFFALYANVDGFVFDKTQSVPVAERSELDRWIISKLNSLIKFTEEKLDDFDPTPAGRAIEDFVCEDLSNWYVRLSRRVFWKGEMNKEKQAAYETLYTCLETVSRLISPYAPFFADRLYMDLNASQTGESESVHLSRFPLSDSNHINTDLEEKMDYAQKISSMILSLRKKEKIRVRQPLRKVSIPVLNPRMKELVEEVKELILSEVNVKELTFLYDTDGVIKKKLKPDFKKLGPKFGKDMKAVADAIAKLTAEEISELEKENRLNLKLSDKTVELSTDDLEILTEDIPGSLVATEGGITVALDITLDEALISEGIARDLVNRIQNIRKETGLEITDRIRVTYKSDDYIQKSIENNLGYICAEILADTLVPSTGEIQEIFTEVELGDNMKAEVFVSKV
ncbi:MAG: isoleucine--tRNA ligase [Flavobacteriales bacterium]|nr:isoleucine--tRNA ligase [Flavobacteriales bacterium]